MFLSLRTSATIGPNQKSVDEKSKDKEKGVEKGKETEKEPEKDKGFLENNKGKLIITAILLLSGVGAIFAVLAFAGMMAAEKINDKVQENGGWKEVLGKIGDKMKGGEEKGVDEQEPKKQQNIELAEKPVVKDQDKGKGPLQSELDKIMGDVKKEKQVENPDLAEQSKDKAEKLAQDKVQKL